MELFGVLNYLNGSDHIVIGSYSEECRVNMLMWLYYFSKFL